MTEPVGTISLVAQTLRVSLADSPAFRDWTGTDNQAAALAHVHKDDLPPPAGTAEAYTPAELSALRPFVLFWFGSMSEDADSVSSSFEFSDRGEFTLRFEQDVDPLIDDDEAEIVLRFENTLGQILDDLKGTAGTAGYLAVTGWSWDAAVRREDKDRRTTKGDVVEADVTLRWGD